MNTAGIMCIQARAKDSNAFFYYGVDTLKHDDVYPERWGVVLGRAKGAAYLIMTFLMLM